MHRTFPAFELSVWCIAPFRLRIECLVHRINRNDWLPIVCGVNLRMYGSTFHTWEAFPFQKSIPVDTHMSLNDQTWPRMGFTLDHV